MKPSNFFHAVKRRGESGQSIIVLGIAFLALLGFVGIVTDVSLLFVRYSGLRRAVDAAAVSAAGQMRTDRNFATVNFAARTFIEFYGIDPTAVEVQTCLTAPGDPELCTPEQRKLVRVRAQILSPTVFMRLLGFRDIILEASSTSETAVMDVVLVIDVSESMGEATSLGLPAAGPFNPAGIDYDYADIGMGFVYRPPIITHLLTNPDAIAARWYFLTSQHQAAASDLDASNFPVIRNTPVVPAISDTVGGPAITALGPQQVFRGAVGGSTLEPRESCRVRFYPNFSRQVEAGGLPTWDGLLTYYRDTPGMGGAWQYNPSGIAYWNGYVPTYNFYGCCNDPGNGSVDLNGNITNPTNSTGDFNFSDLICQPFKAARDAVRDFLQRVDFTRGDRVAMVTFNRSAFLIDPDGSQANATHMMDTFPMALNTLNQVIGLNAEPNFYNWDEIDGGWDGFAAGSYDDDNDVDTPNQSILIRYDDPQTAANPGVHDNFPVYGNCYMMNAVQGYPNSRYSSLTSQGAILDTARLPEPLLYGTVSLARTYTQRGACRDANIGAAIREANNALNFDDTRRVSGAVWVIILVSDGAAGASDPVLRAGARAIVPNPYNPALNGGPIVGQYGAFGVCPYVDSLDSASLPFCSDTSPETRQFCDFDPRNEVADRPEPVDIYSSECQSSTDIGGIPRYDVDDYARDWADWVSLLESEAGEFQPIRPTIFTIGFGITFSNGSGTCAENVDDCLGEELLRYIADVGDNFRLDIDYQQDYYFDTMRNGDPGPQGWGPRGLCEGPGTSGQVVRLPETQSCGNYYNAPGAAELDAVFDDIASKMFTRIAN